MAQNIIYSPWEGIKRSLTMLDNYIIIIGLLWLFSFVSAYSHFSD